ncbi:hypothetical protein GALMADRAFT_147697 [Galerina marginata CBS 339.88]|uniref:Uncharacterized protein n=1 Tax=Galerina marginata (strain CBS 339.88) TaxID=685588 RepID=A0A067SFY4_GALM3|nr:hypothetical protein GALMADRAFT_147697 [Galerina marginata CBS 339.88]
MNSDFDLIISTGTRNRYSFADDLVQLRPTFDFGRLHAPPELRAPTTTTPLITNIGPSEDTNGASLLLERRLPSSPSLAFLTTHVQFSYPKTLFFTLLDDHEVLVILTPSAHASVEPFYFSIISQFDVGSIVPTPWPAGKLSRQSIPRTTTSDEACQRRPRPQAEARIRDSHLLHTAWRGAEVAIPYRTRSPVSMGAMGGEELVDDSGKGENVGSARIAYEMRWMGLGQLRMVLAAAAAADATERRRGG